MADQIKVSTQVLTETAGEIDRLNAQMSDKLRDINTKMQNLSSTWRSEAADEIRNAMNNMKPRFEEYQNVVDSYAKFLRSTAQSYESTEQVVQSNAQQFK